MERTANLDLPYIMPSQAQKHVTHNEAIRALDAIVQLGVIDRDRVSPPSASAEGDRHIVAVGATGKWLGRDLKIAAWQDGAWMFYTPAPGWIAWIAAEDRLVAWAGDRWISACGRLAAFETVSVNGARADGYNRLAIRARASLLDHEDGSHQLVVNKNDPADTASVLFQTAYSGRAEFGLAGDDNWHVKVSADGQAWTEALATESSGLVAFGGPIRLAHFTRATLPSAAAGTGALAFVADATGGATPAFSDGSVWRRLGDRSPIG